MKAVADKKMKIVGYIVVNPAHPSCKVAALSETEGEVYAVKKDAERVAVGLRKEYENPDITVWGVVR